MVNQRTLCRGKVLFCSLASNHAARAKSFITAKDGAILPDSRLLSILELGHEGLANALNEGNVGVKQNVRAIIGDRTGRKLRHVNHGGGFKVNEGLGLVARDISRINYGDIAFTKFFHPLSARSAIAQCTRLLGVTGKQSHDPYCDVIIVSSGLGARKLLAVPAQKAPARARDQSPYHPSLPACAPTPPRARPAKARPHQK